MERGGNTGTHAYFRSISTCIEVFPLPVLLTYPNIINIR